MAFVGALAYALPPIWLVPLPEVNVHNETVPLSKIDFRFTQMPVLDEPEFANFIHDMFAYSSRTIIDLTRRRWADAGIPTAFPQNNPGCMIRGAATWTNQQGVTQYFGIRFTVLQDAAQTFQAKEFYGNNSFDADEFANSPDRSMLMELRFLKGREAIEYNANPREPLQRRAGGGVARDFEFDGLVDDGFEQGRWVLQAPPRAVPLGQIRRENQARLPQAGIPIMQQNAGVQTRAMRRAANEAILRTGREHRSGNIYLPNAPGGHRRVGSGKLSYAKMKRKIYMSRKTVGEFYSLTNMLIYSPPVANNLCFPMAFLRCQLRDHIRPDGYHVIDVLETEGESSAEMFWAKHGAKFDLPKVRNSILEGFANFVSEDWQDRPFFNMDGDVILFNPYKQALKRNADGFMEYESFLDYNADDISEEQRGEIVDFVTDWEMAAVMLHAYVEECMGHAVDWTIEKEVAAAYAMVFNVNVHLYDLVGIGRRYATYAPPYGKCSRHVAVCIESNHASAVSNVRWFVKNSKGSMKVGPAHFCDTCTQTTTTDNYPKADALKHLSYCAHFNKDFKTRSSMKVQSDLQKSLEASRTVKKQTWSCCPTCGTPARITPKTSCVKDGHDLVFVDRYMCSCGMCLSKGMVGLHQCYVKRPKINAPLDPNLIWVWDTEAKAQRVNEEYEGGMLFKHICNKTCMQKVYDEDGASVKSFPDAESFCAQLCESDEFDDTIWIAHNSAKYDSHWVLKYAEEHNVPHEWIPTPGSDHGLLSLTLYPVSQRPRTFIDFRAFCPGSLKAIGKSFGAKCSKGDFPHAFNRTENEGHVGFIPPLHSVEDYYGYRTKKSKGEQQELDEWHAKECERYCHCWEGDCVCNLEKWNFQEELEKYCRLDVAVLAECARKYRDALLNPGETVIRQGAEEWEQWIAHPIDPFTYITQGQLGITLFLNGFTNPDAMRLASVQYNFRDNYDPLMTDWIRWKNDQLDVEYQIHYKGNSIREFYCVETNKFYDGYQEATNTVYFYQPCDYYACPCLNQPDDEIHGKRNMTCKKIREALAEEMLTLTGAAEYNVIVKKTCDHIEEDLGGAVCMKVMEDRSFFYGGRTEVFASYCKAESGHTIIHRDVCSLYPYVCAKGLLPKGHCQVLSGRFVSLEKLLAREYYGFVKCHVIPNREDVIGLLPAKDEKSHRLVFDLKPKVGEWHTSELYLAMDNGYVVDRVYQVYHWREEDRSDSLFRGYVQHFLREKQQADGWKKAGASTENPDDYEQAVIIQRLFEENGDMARMVPENVKTNDVARAKAKNFLNSLWGKFTQSTRFSHFAEINGAKEYYEFTTNPLVDLSSLDFRHVTENYFKVKYSRTGDHRTSANKYNVFLGASVTALARCELHKMLLKIVAVGGQVCYADTDSCVAKIPTDRLPEIPLGRGLGQWTDEKPGKKILKFVALAPKNYSMVIEGADEIELKAKGVVLHRANKEMITDKLLENIVSDQYALHKPEERVIPPQMENMNIFSNSTMAEHGYATLMTRENSKVMRSVLSKRMAVEVDNRYDDGEVYELDIQEMGTAKTLPFHHVLLDLPSDDLSEEVYGERRKRRRTD